MMRCWRTPIAIAFISLILLISAEAGEIKLFSSTGMKEVFYELLPQYERMSGDKLNVTFEVTAALKTRIEAGEPFDVAVLVSSAYDDLYKRGKLASRVDLARTGIGLAVRSGAKKPDITTVESFKQTLLASKTIAVPSAGFAGTYFLQVIERLGLSREIGPKIVFDTSGGYTAQIVALGGAELAVHLISEILPVQGAELVGPLPDQLQKFVVLTAGIATTAQESQRADALIRFLSGPEAAAVYRAKGMEPEGCSTSPDGCVEKRLVPSR